MWHTNDCIQYLVLTNMSAKHRKINFRIVNVRSSRHVCSSHTNAQQWRTSSHNKPLCAKHGKHHPSPSKPHHHQLLSTFFIHCSGRKKAQKNVDSPPIPGCCAGANGCCVGGGEANRSRPADWPGAAAAGPPRLSPISRLELSWAGAAAGAGAAAAGATGEATGTDSLLRLVRGEACRGDGRRGGGAQPGAVTHSGRRTRSCFFFFSQVRLENVVLNFRRVAAPIG